MGVAISSFSDVPPIAKRCLDFLEVDGVFRIENFSLQTPSLTEVLRLVKQFEDTDPLTLNLAFESPDTVCGVLRKWLRSLPEPLFSYEFYDAWMSLQHTQVNEDLFGEIQTVLFQLHPTHYACMQRIFRFLHKLASYGVVNRLTIPVLGFNWQPCLIWSQANATALDPMRVAPDGGIAGSIVATMIEHYDKLFVEETTWVPPEFDIPPSTASNPPSSAPSAASTPHATPIAISALNGPTSLNGSSSSLPPFSGSPAPTLTSAQSDPVGVSTSSASISHSDEDDNSSSQPGSLQPPVGVHMANGIATHSESSSGIVVSPPIGIAQPSSSPANASFVAHYQQQTSQQSTPQGSPQVPHPLAGGIPSSTSGSPSSQTSSTTNTLPPISIPTYGQASGVANSVPVTPITPLPTAAPAQPLARSFAGAHSTSSNNLPTSTSPSLGRTSSSAKMADDASSSPRSSTNLSATTPLPARKKQPVVINGYTQGTAICDFTDMSDGMLQFFKNEHIYITFKHEDGWWEGWKRGRRGFFPAQYIVEIAI